MSERRVIDFDHHSPSFAAAPDKYYPWLRQVTPAWSEKHGGFWVFATYEQIAMVERDLETWSWRNDMDAPGTAYTGIGIPRTIPVALPPLEMDPPEHADHRKPLNMPFSARSIKRFETELRRVVVQCIEAKRESGQIDLVLDLANPVPAVMTMWLTGLPEQEWAEYALPVHAMGYAAAGTPEAEAAFAGVTRFSAGSAR